MPEDLTPSLVPEVVEDEAAQALERRLKSEVLADPTEHFKNMQRLSNQIRQVAIAETRPQDWIQMGKNGTVYLQATGAERVARIGGVTMEPPTVEREDYPDGTFAYYVKGRMKCDLFRLVIHVEGGRSSADEFFDRFSIPKPENWPTMTAGERREWRLANRQPVQAGDVRKAADANWRVRGLSQIFGLRGLTIEDLKHYGIDTTKIGGVTYGSGSQGGKARASAETTPPFGPRPNTPLFDLTIEELETYKAAAERSIKDPSKAQYRAKETARLEAITKEIESRNAQATT